MGLFEKVTEDLKAAMLAREKDKLEPLRALKTAFLHAKTEKGGSDQLTAEGELKIVQKLIKQRKESASIYKEQGRDDLYQNEMAEAKVIEKYLPEQMSDDDVEKALQAIIIKVNASSIKDMGKVMGIASKELAGKADNRVIADIVKKILNKGIDN
jgi:uncharacterized protein YqeY